MHNRSDKSCSLYFEKVSRMTCLYSSSIKSVASLAKVDSDEPERRLPRSLVCSLVVIERCGVKYFTAVAA